MFRFQFGFPVFHVFLLHNNGPFQMLEIAFCRPALLPGRVAGRRTNYGEAPRLRLRYLSKIAILRKGMKVYTDGRGDLFPANIPIGTIEDFEVGPVYGEAEIIPAVDFTNLKTVFVIADSPGD